MGSTRINETHNGQRQQCVEYINADTLSNDDLTRLIYASVSMIFNTIISNILEE